MYLFVRTTSYWLVTKEVVVRERERERDHRCSLLCVLYTKYTEGLEQGRSDLSILLCARYSSKCKGRMLVEYEPSCPCGRCSAPVVLENVDIAVYSPACC